VDKKYESFLKWEFKQFKKKIEKRNTKVDEQFINTLNKTPTKAELK
jgi:hypothetical protein